jgi:hypothetical protein
VAEFPAHRGLPTRMRSFRGSIISVSYSVDWKDE